MLPRNQWKLWLTLPLGLCGPRLGAGPPRWAAAFREAMAGLASGFLQLVGLEEALPDLPSRAERSAQAADGQAVSRCLACSLGF